MFWIFLTMYPNVIDSSFCSYALEEDRYHYIFIENFSALQETIFWRNYKNSAIVYNRNTYAACIRKCTIDKKILQTEVHKIHLGFSHVVKILKCVWLSAIYISPFLKPVWCMEQCVENHWKDFSLPTIKARILKIDSIHKCANPVGYNTQTKSSWSIEKFEHGSHLSPVNPDKEKKISKPFRKMMRWANTWEKSFIFISGLSCLTVSFP